ncbi:MAG TPA: hypothetical protein VIK30_01360, partial [Polyangia bacterium]
MREPSRLREETSSALERALLEAGTSYRSPASARAKTLGALGLAGSATILAGATQAAPLSAFAKMTWTKLLATISVVGVAAAVPVGYYAWHRHAVAGHAAPAHAPAVALAQAAEPPAPEEAPAGPAPASTVATAVAPAPDVGVGVGSLAHSPEMRPSTVTLARELSSIDAARALLAQGDGEGALARLDAYARVYPRGR